MFKIIIWDFDGVIIFSNEVREEGFREIFKQYSESQIDQLLTYHRINGGLSRYVKIRYFFEEILGESIEEKQIIELASEFSDIMKKKLTNKSLLNEDWLAFMEEGKTKYVHHIASGSDQNELRLLCKELGINTFFTSIHGSPTPKNQLVSDIIQSNNYVKSEIVLVGDAINDYEAAKVNEIGFRGYNNTELKEVGDYLIKLNGELG